ncbi:MAG: hypothetical protein AUJ52_03705 [Elusimicrobia bacterium CG1_02_63_36]|nr:MAG: hypothetical protein AUJ52_03705 [Elusimicrobia bacterium CG1_02_63_36]
MRWWLYDGKKTTGPFSKDDLARLPGVLPETPLCREHKLGSAQEEWLRAVDVPEVAGIFPPSSRERAGASLGPLAKPGPWPPDASRRDVDDYKNVEQRMEIVDRSLAAAQKRISLRTDRFHRLQEELKRRLDTAEALDDKIRAMAAKIGGFVGLREELDQARAAMAMQQHRIGELQEHMKELEKPPPPPPPPPAPEPRTPRAEPVFEAPVEEAPSRKRRKRSRRERKEKRGSSDPFADALPEAEFKTESTDFG